MTLGIVVVLQVAVVYWVPLQRLFAAQALSLADWAICFGVASSVFVAEETRKVAARGIRLVFHGRPGVGLPRMAPRIR